MSALTLLLLLITFPSPSVEGNPATARKDLVYVSESFLLQRRVSSRELVYPMSRNPVVMPGIVVRVIFDAQGQCQEATIVAGHPLLNDSVIQHVRSWRILPPTIDGKAVPVTGIITVWFRDYPFPFWGDYSPLVVGEADGTYRIDGKMFTRDQFRDWLSKLSPGTILRLPGDDSVDFSPAIDFARAAGVISTTILAQDSKRKD